MNPQPPDLVTGFDLAMTLMQVEVHRNAKEKGWWREATPYRVAVT